MNLTYFLVLLSALAWACGSAGTESQAEARTGAPRPRSAAQVPAAAAQLERGDRTPAATPTVGAERWDEVLAAIGQRRVGVVVNHTSRSGDEHLVDRLQASGVTVVRVFAPEHGFRGEASDGEVVRDAVDTRTGLPIVSLYGKSKRPTRAMLDSVELLVFDIQDVGARFYTYISTLHYVMDAGAEYGVPVLVLDRPNPNGHYVDGPVLDTAYRSFVGMHPIPVVHGLTVGELARMINGERWLPAGREAALEVVPVADYRVGEVYALPERPSPNLPTQQSVYLYPSLCWFEGTVASVGRGTDFPFQVYGHPRYPDSAFAFTPEARPGAAYAKLSGDRCYGVDLRDVDARGAGRIDLTYLLAMRDSLGVDGFIDRPEHFDALAGSDRLRHQVEAGADEAAIRATWQEGLAAFSRKRSPYLLYDRVGED